MFPDALQAWLSFGGSDGEIPSLLPSGRHQEGKEKTFLLLFFNKKLDTHKFCDWSCLQAWGSLAVRGPEPPVIIGPSEWVLG